MENLIKKEPFPKKKINLEQVDAFVFDMDGVIFDSERGCLNVWRTIAEENKLPDIETVFKQCIGTTNVATRQILMDAYGRDFDVDRFTQQASKRFHERFDDGRLPILPGAESLLIKLNELGVPVGLASSTREASVRRELTDAGLIKYFKNITCGDMLKVSKPEPDIYLLACRNLCVEPSRAVAVEDSFNGIRSAYRAGMVPVMVPDLIPADEEMRQLSFEIYDSLYEVAAAF